MAEQTGANFAYLHASMRIGSCKAPISYGPAQVVFHHDDIPKANRARKAEVMDWKKSKILSNDRGAWNISTDPQVPVCERRQMENFVNDRSKKYTFNYRAESVDSLRNLEPIDKPTKFHISSQLERTASHIESLKQQSLLNRGQYRRTEEMPVHGRANDVGSWNNSTTITTKEISTGLNKLTTKCMTRTSTANSQILGRSGRYTSPMQSTQNQIEQVREQKREEFFDPRLYLNRPRTNEATRKQTNQAYNHEAVERNVSYKTDRHTGVWQYNASENKHMWSDTGSFDFNSRGDQSFTHNPFSHNMPRF